MEPGFMVENKYSYLVGSYRPPRSASYEAQTPETQFEQKVQSLFLEGQDHLQHEEHTLALNAFRELLALILHTAHPQMPIDPYRFRLEFPVDLTLVDVLCARSAAMLSVLPVVSYELPATMASQTSVLPAAVAKKLAEVSATGVQVTSFQADVSRTLDAAQASAEAGDWKGALTSYRAALKATPDTELAVQGALLQDMAVLSEKAGDQDGAVKLARRSVDTLAGSDAVETRVVALETATGVLQRAGQADLAKELTVQADDLRRTKNLSPVLLTAGGDGGRTSTGLVGRLGAALTRVVGVGAAVRTPATELDQPVRRQLLGGPVRAGGGVVSAEASVSAPTLVAAQVLGGTVATKAFVVQGLEERAQIVLDADGPASSKAFLQQLSTTADLGLLTRYLVDPVQLVAYLPHLYFYAVPMAIGDCLAGMGDLDQAIAQYQGVLRYPFINAGVEIVRLWTRLAQAYLDQGDAAYRAARDDVSRFDAARVAYENVVSLDGTVPAGSPLYADGRFGTVAGRVRDFLAAPDRAAHPDNPAITAIVLQALGRLQQIAQGLNFFGFGVDYVPPFSFEYLQNTARYFAQQASQIEQRYIQFKSQAENEELRRDQLEQQAQVAFQSVILEQRGVAEARRGVDVAAASAAYASTQVDNANEAKSDFEDNRWELLELAEAEAWAGASSVDRDDQVQLSWHGSYYSSDHRRRNQVLKDLAYQRARLSQDLEENRLDREIAAATDYLAVAQAQRAQAEARVAVAEQRVVVAQLQQAYAEQNRDFLDLREFGAQLWYDLARQAARIKQRYLDMATEIAFLTERAYEAETERGLHVVRYDYAQTDSGNLMGADLLLADIDLFTFDHVTTTKTKKLPVKTTISIADAYPVQFNRLKTTGTCMFETALEDFDRSYPGLYLAKVRNVELVFVGISGATSIAGTLRNVGVSRFRRADGSVVARLYPADVMALSQFDLRQDALAFPFSPNDLRLFENNGLATSWQIQLPPSANDFDLADILDVHLVICFDGFYDRVLEDQVRAALPTSGSASRAFSLAMSFPDELFFLLNQGTAQLDFDATFFPHSQRDLRRTSTVIKVVGEPAAVANLTVQLSSPSLPGPVALVTDAAGEVSDAAAGSPLRALRGTSVLDQLSLTVTAADNPALVVDGVLDLAGIRDVLIFGEYDFDYR